MVRKANRCTPSPQAYPRPLSFLHGTRAKAAITNTIALILAVFAIEPA